ncbi:type II CAAX endopeptidase family protein [Parabacteroides sp. PF5-6]|uniref:CPBP family intramembrane glutamic endopeptidase n=1 Tax=Parabacteroides sp. PF5-6 TaxID=1742403 RepID=UPI002404EF14|nr:type II CAAX endopeptidase family protein [Parabacteroides sp. PF5-6]MDF9828679.1 membrane protease YdiL (CAAX protease family) [Parabacteroides sp. PF5-6]
MEPQETPTIEKKEPVIDKGWVRVLLIILPWMILLAIFQAIGMWVAGIPFDSENNQATLWQEVIMLVFSLIATLGVVWLFVRKVDEEPFKHIGLQLKGQAKNIGIGLLTGFLIIGVGFFILWQTGQVRITEISFDIQSFMLSILLFLLVSVNEEIIFRGYVQRNLMASMNKYVALLVSSFFFSLAHFANPAFGGIPLLTIFLSGILIGLPYLFNRNLLYPIALHFSWNFMQAIAGFNVSGQELYALTHLSIDKENHWNGGAFGFEGSLLCVILSVIAIGLIWGYYARPVSAVKGASTPPSSNYR